MLRAMQTMTNREGVFMTPEQYAEGISKGLEAWTLQTTIDTAVVFSFLVLGLVCCRAYLDAYKKRMTLRLSVEIWDVAIDLFTDLLSFGALLIGFLTCNPDVMIDAKIAVPWLPLANLAMGAALYLRAFFGGHRVASRAWWAALVLVLLACAMNWFGFIFVMEGATDEYFDGRAYPAYWSSLHGMRSDVNLHLGLITFYALEPVYVMMFLAFVLTGLRRTLGLQSDESLPGVGADDESAGADGTVRGAGR